MKDDFGSRKDDARESFTCASKTYVPKLWIFCPNHCLNTKQEASKRSSSNFYVSFLVWDPHERSQPGTKALLYPSIIRDIRPEISYQVKLPHDAYKTSDFEKFLKAAFYCEDNTSVWIVPAKLSSRAPAKAFFHTETISSSWVTDTQQLRHECSSLQISSTLSLGLFKRKVPSQSPFQTPTTRIFIRK